MLLLYFLRGTVLPWYLHISQNALVIGNIGLLVAAAGLAISGAGRWRLAWTAVMIACALSVTQAEQVSNSSQRLLGLALLMIGVGPMVVNPKVVGLRAAAWGLVVRGLPWLSGTFVVWYALRLPNFGAGHFSGFMNQCMLAGPLAGLGGAIALVRAFGSRSWKWGVLSVVSLAPVLASGSRVATLATAATYCLIVLRRKPILGGLGALFLLAAILAFVFQPQSSAESESLTGALAKKGTVNSRAELWQSRIAEFKSSPLFGIGVAMGTGNSSTVEGGGNIRVEPGSSYLAILAMTGLFGVVTFSWALSQLILQFVQAKPRGQEAQVVVAMGVFLAVHGVAEGWVLAFGSPLAFLFWLWLGRMGDETGQVACSVRATGPTVLRPLRGFRLRVNPMHGGGRARR